MNLSQLLVASARCKALLGQGIIDIANGNYSAALPKIEEALQNNPNDIYALQYRGICQCLLVVEHENTNQENQDRLYNAASDFLKSIRKQEEATQSILHNLQQ